MDAKNTFDTPVTYRLIRAEYAVGLAVALGFFFAHITEMRWLPAVGLFLYIDLIGYIPGAIAYHRSEDKAISKVYYVLYNTMHSLATQTVVASPGCGWPVPSGRCSVIPSTSSATAALFGNFLKPFGLDFEPVAQPMYQKLIAALQPSAKGRPDVVQGAVSIQPGAPR